MSGLLDLFIPKEKKFFDELLRQVIVLDKSIDTVLKLSKKVTAKTLFEYLEKTKKLDESSEKINKLITIALHQTFITPIDREDIKALSLDIHRLVNSVHKIIASIYYFKIKTLSKHFLLQLQILRKQTKALKIIFQKILSHKNNQPLILQIRQLEKEGDDIFRQGMGELFNKKSRLSMDIIKQKELYEITEDAIDDAKHIADILEMVLINNS